MYIYGSLSLYIYVYVMYIVHMLMRYTTVYVFWNWHLAATNTLRAFQTPAYSNPSKAFKAFLEARVFATMASSEKDRPTVCLHYHKST